LSAKTGYEDLHISPLRRALLRPIYQRARQFRFYREAVGFLHKFGYGLFRRYALALGERLAGRGIIKTQEDVYYLHLNEIRSSVRGQGSESSLKDQIAARKLEMEECLHITPPGTIYGDQAPPLDFQTSGTLKGTPTSRGCFSGPVKVIRGITNFSKLQEGDVLVIQFSDVGWTPLFAKAGAVIAESGGILSHSSIVAREYGIPAVVSVPGACRLEDGTLVTVDGYRGEIIVHEHLNTGISPEPALDKALPFEQEIKREV
jgi:phosphohistidine swiveling domain-containing protein